MKSAILKRLVVVGSLIFGSGAFVATSGATDHHAASKGFDRSESTRTIAITPSGGSGAQSSDLAFSGLLPGSPQTVTLDYRNTGTSAEDVYVVFTNATAVSALDSLGTLGQVRLSSAGDGALGDVFDSSNLSDSLSVCGHFSSSGCWPLLHQYELARHLTPSQSGSFSFRFGLSTADTVQPAAGQTGWNPYPVKGQTVVVPSDGSGTGLPYELVATQPGITPGQTGTITQDEPFGESRRVAETGADFHDQLAVRGAVGTVTFVVTTPNTHLDVSSSGVVTTVGGPLPAGRYEVSGTDSDTSGNVGTWRYTLVVNAGSITCGGADDDRVDRSRSRHFVDRLSDCDARIVVHYVTTRSDHVLHVSDDGVVTVVGDDIAPGRYTVSGTEHDSYGDAGAWSYTLSVY